MTIHDIQAELGSSAVLRARVAALEAALDQSHRDVARLEVCTGVMRRGIEESLCCLYPDDAEFIGGMIDEEASITLPRAVKLVAGRPSAHMTRLCVLAADAEALAARNLGQVLMTNDPEQAVRQVLKMLAAEVTRLASVQDADNHRLRAVHEHLFVRMFPYTDGDELAATAGNTTPGPGEGNELRDRIVSMIDALAGFVEEPQGGANG
ncbi:MAG: hypothetical protein RLZZ373_3242 [Pseudomonadota bacterium]|jgi:hypothetical protein